jgi:hypothetical protein
LRSRRRTLDPYSFTPLRRASASAKTEKGDGAAWCMSFIMTCLAYAEVRTGVKSPVYASEHCLTVFKNTPESQRVKKFPARGAIIIWQHGSSSNGHTGVFLEAQDDGGMRAIEGNAEKGLAPDGSVEREGGGIYLTSRSMKANGTMKVVGYLKPF